MATVIVLVGCYYGYTASGGPVGVGTATAKSMVLNTVMVHIVGMLGHPDLLGYEPASPDRRLTMSAMLTHPHPLRIRTDVDERAGARRAARPDRPARGAARGSRDERVPPLPHSAAHRRLERRAASDARRARGAPRRARGRGRTASAASSTPLGERQEHARGRMEAIMLDPAAHRWERVTQRRHRRAGLPPVPRAPAPRPARVADELVAGHHLLRVSVMHALGRSAPLAVYRAVARAGDRRRAAWCSGSASRCSGSGSPAS